MDSIIDETIEDAQITTIARAYEESKAKGGEQETVARFQYAHALIRSRHCQDIKRGISILEDLYYEGNQETRRDYMYYIAIGQTRMKQYNLALDCVNLFLQQEPENRQAKQLRAFIKERLNKEGLMGMAITGGAVLALGGLLGLAVSLSKR